MKRSLLVGRVLLGVAPVVTLTACLRHTAPVEGGLAASSSSAAPTCLAPSSALPRPALGLASGPADDAAPAAGPQQPAPAPLQTPEDVAAAQRKAEEILAANRRVLVDEYLAKARTALNNADVDGARAWYGKALEIDPTNADANQGWKNLSADRASDVRDYTDRSRREEVIKRDEAAAQVAGHMKRGRTAESGGAYGDAVKEYQSALAIVSWYADQSAFGVTSESLNELIKNTRLKAARDVREKNTAAASAAQKRRELDLAAERQERLGRIRAYFQEADLAFRRGEFAAAREYARAVLKEDPQNTSATRLIDMTWDAEHTAKLDYNNKTFAEEYKRVFEDIEEKVLPQVRTIEFPDNWDEISRRKPRSVGDADDATESESKQAILTALRAKRVKGLQFSEQNLDQVVTYLRTVTGLNFHITPKVRSTKFDEVKVTIPGLDDVTVEEVLNLITSQHELRWEPRDGVVTIAMKDEVAGTLRLKYFDVRDLAVKIQNYRGTDIYLAPSNYTPPEPPELPEPSPIYPTEQLVDTIKEMVAKESWAAEGASLELKGGTLIGRNTVEVLNEVQTLLDELRRNSGPLVSMEVRFITVEDNFLRDVGVDVRGLGDNAQGIGVAGLGANAPNDDLFFGTPANPQGVPLGVKPEPASAGTSNDSGAFYNDGSDGAYRARIENLFDSVLGNQNTLLGTGGMALQHTFLDDTQVEVILRAVQKSERVQQITATKLTVYNTQRATVEVLNKVAYVADYDVEIAQAANIANPIIKNAIDGVVLDVKPVVSADRRFITLELRPTVATLVRPIPTFSTSLASGPVTASAPVVIQIPKLQKSSVRTTVTMPDGGTLLLGGLTFYEQVDATSEVPILGKIPVLGFMFSRKGHYVNRKNLIVLISAQVEVLDEQEPKGDYTPPLRPEATIPLMELPEEESCEMFTPPPAPACAPPPPACGCK